MIEKFCLLRMTAEMQANPCVFLDSAQTSINVN
jgi:hypothetical protein